MTSDILSHRYPNAGTQDDCSLLRMRAGKVYILLQLVLHLALHVTRSWKVRPDGLELHN